MRRRHVSALFETRAREEEVPPLLQGRELVDVYAGTGFFFGDESANRDRGHGQRKDGAISLLNRAFEKAYLLQLPIPRRIYLPACTCRRRGSPTWTTAGPCPWCGTGGGSRSCTCQWRRGASPARSLVSRVSQTFHKNEYSVSPLLTVKVVKLALHGAEATHLPKDLFRSRQYADFGVGKIQNPPSCSPPSTPASRRGRRSCGPCRSGPRGTA